MEHGEELCLFWTNIGECILNEKWMSINCQKSCQKCDSPTLLPIDKESTIMPHHMSTAELTQGQSSTMQSNRESSTSPQIISTVQSTHVSSTIIPPHDITTAMPSLGESIYLVTDKYMCM